MARKFVCAWLVVCMLTSLCPAGAFAQSTSVPADRDAYVSEVASRAALEQDLAQRQADADYRRSTIQESIDRLRSQSTPVGRSQSDWTQERDARIKWLEEYQRRNDETLGRYEQNLTSVRSDLARDRQVVMGSDDPQLRQALGSLMGAAGIAGIPVYSRPTVGTLKAAVGRSMMGMKLNSTNKSITKAQARSAALTEQAAGFKAPTKGQWVSEVGANGNQVLRNGEVVKDLGVKAEVDSASGQKIKNDIAARKGSYYSEIYTARSNIEYSIQKLKYDRSVTKNAKGQKALDAKITELEAKKVQLEQDIAKHDAANPSSGSVMKNLAKDAGKWALFSVGVTLSTRAFDELRANNWDFRAIDWGNVVAPLKTAEFWGGTAGSFVGSMALSALIPGGAFVKTLVGIGGAAIGWQLGSGNLMQTDWVELGATTLGGTIGCLLGSFLGPVGTFIGGMAGNYLALWLLEKVREWGAGKFQSFDRSTRTDYQVDTTAAPYVYQAPAGSGYDRPDQDGSGYGTGDAAEIQTRMMSLQSEMQAIMLAPSSAEQMSQLNAKRTEYGQLQRTLESLRAQAGPGSLGGR